MDQCIAVSPRGGCCRDVTQTTDFFKSQLAPDSCRHDFAMRTFQLPQRVHHFIGNQGIGEVIVHGFRNGDLLFTISTSPTGEALVLSEVSGDSIEPGDRLFRWPIKGRQPAERLLHHILRRRASSSDPQPQWNGMPFNKFSNLLGGVRH